MTRTLFISCLLACFSFSATAQTISGVHYSFCEHQKDTLQLGDFSACKLTATYSDTALTVKSFRFALLNTKTGDMWTTERIQGNTLSTKALELLNKHQGSVMKIYMDDLILSSEKQAYIDKKGTYFVVIR